MGYITSVRWYKKDFNIKWLFKNGFKYSKEYSDLDSDAYVYTFTIYKYKLIPLYECLIILYADNGEVIVKMQDKNKNIYPQFYHDSQGNQNKLINKMEQTIIKELERLGIEPIKVIEADLEYE